MPKINTIAIVPVPKLSDKLVGTSVGGTPVNQTNNFTLQQLKTLFDGTPTSPTLQAVLNAGNTATQNIYLTGTIDTVNLDVSNDSFLKNLYLSERLFDKNNFQGTSGQYLTSTGTGVQWSTLTIATPTLQQVLTAGNISDKNIITTGNIQAANIQGTNITANTNLRIVGTLSDSSNSVGGSGQVLSSTVTGTDWIDFPSYSAVSPLIYNNVLKQFSIQVATSTQNGYLSAADWITFNGKQNAGNYITALTGEASALGPGSVNITLNNLAVINKTLTGLAIASGVITAADSIITAFGKIQGQINGIVAGVVYQGVWNAATNTPTLTSSVGVQGHYYVVDVAGNTNLNGITDWQVGDWAIYNGTAWQKVDNTDSVTSVNGQTGIVVLNSDDIAEGTTNLYYLDSRARAAISSVATGLTYTSATGVFSLTAGYSIPTNSNQTNWTTAYNDSIVSAAVTGTTTKTLTLTQQDGGTITASWTDIDTNLVTSVFGRTGAVVAQAGDYSTTLVTEGTNLYYLDSRARSAISSSATGLTYTTATGVFSFTAGYSIPTDASQSNWTTAYNDSIISAAVTGTTTKTLTLNQQDGGTITASWTDLDTGLTSVGLSMPSAFNVTNTPLTSNGTIAVTAAGLASQYVRGDGTLGDFPTGGGGGGASVSYYLNGSINQGTFGGNTYYQMSKTPIIGTGTDFSISADGYIAQFITDVGVPDALLIPGGNWNFELYFSASSGGGSPSFYVELYKYDGTTFTLISSGSATPELIAFGTVINPYFVPLAVPETVLTLTDRIAIRVYVNHSGRTITLHTEDNHLCQIITTFTTGLTALNGLTKQVQYFAVGTSGSDFNISSSVATHTFNLPTASAVNRGALSSSDWSTFNGKQNALTLTTSGSSGPATLVGATLNIPDYGSALSGYVPYTGASQAVNLGIYSLSAGSLFVNGPAPTSGSYLGFKQATSVTTGGGGYTSISTFGTSQMNFSFAQPSGFKEFKFDVSSITTGVPGGRVYTMPDADGTIALVGGSGVGTVTSVAALTLGTSGTDLSSTVANSTTTPVITLNVPTASATNRGALSSADWSTFNAKQNALTLTTTGSSGASTLVGATLNVPNYTLSGLGGVPTSRQLTINGTAFDLSADRSWSVGTVTSVGLSSATSGVTIGNTPVTGSGTITLAIATATSTQQGLLSSTDWSTFNNKQNALTLTTTGTSGAATLVGATLNIPQYQAAGTYVTSVTASSPLASSGGTTPNITIQQATATQNGFLSSTDWSTFNNKQNAITLTTTGTSGASTLVGSTLNIPQYQAVLTNPITGTGTTNYLPKFTGSTTVGNSQVFDNGSGVGIGGTNTDSLLTINGTAGTTHERFREGSTTIGFIGGANGLITGQNGKLAIRAEAGLVLSSQGNSPDVLITSGNLLVGTTSDNGARLQVSGEGRFTNSDGADLIRYAATGVNTNFATKIVSGANDVLVFRRQHVSVGALDIMALGFNGNVGIGTSSPGRQLEVYSATSDTRIAITNTTSTSGAAKGFELLLAGSDAYAFNYVNGAMIFGTNSTERMRITSGGNVGIGTSSPESNSQLTLYGSSFSQLHMQNATTGTGVNGFRLLMDGNNTTLTNREAGYMAFETSDTERMRITSGGNVLIGTTTDVGSKLRVNGVGYFDDSIFSGLQGLNVGGYNFYSQTISGAMGILGHNLRASSSVANQVNVVNSGWYSSMIKMYYSEGITFHTSLTSYNAGDVYPMAATERMRITSGGDVNFSGGAVRADGGYFAVRTSGGSAVSGYLLREATWLGTGTSTNLALAAENPGGELVFFTGGQTTTRMKITSGGNVGIGTASPNRLLTVSGTQGLIALNATSFRNTTIGSDSVGNFIVYDDTAAAYRMVINSSGNVGIGTTSPVYTLDVRGRIYAGTALLIGESGSGYSLIESTGGNGIWLRPNGVSSPSGMFINTSGNVGIGTSSFPASTYKFVVRQGTDRNIAFAEQSSELSIEAYNDLVNANVPLRIYSNKTQFLNGNVLIGTTTDAGYTLNVAGNAQIIKSTTSTALVAGLSGVTGSIIRFSYNGSFVGSISTDGSNTAYNTSSDYRLKEELRPIDNPLQKVLSLNPVNFKYKNSKTRQDGFIAHEIQEILPYLVTGEKDGEQMQEVDYSKLTPILIAAIKEQQKQIEELKNKVS